MAKYLKISIIALSLLLCAFALFSCSDESVSEDDFGNDGYIINGETKEKPEYVMTIGGMNVTLQEYRYHYLNFKRDMDGGNDKHWTDYPEYATVLIDTVEKSLIEAYSVRSLCAEAGVKSDIGAVYDTIDEYKSEMSSSEFNKGLKSAYLTKALWAYVLEGFQLYDKLYEHYFTGDGSMVMSDGEVIDYAEGYYYHTKHILIHPNTTMTDEAYSARINTILEKASESDDFDALIDEYSNDSSMPENGCYFTSDEKHENYEAAVKELEIGEISEPIRTGDGWYIIKRLPIDEGDVDTLRSLIYDRKYADMIEDRIAEIEVEFCPEYNLISPTTLK